MFTMTDFVVQGIYGLIKAFESGFEIEGAVLNEALNELEKYEVDSYYENFKDAGRWDIGLALIYQFNKDGKFYCIWRSVGLTELQESYFDNQIPEIVEKKEKIVTVWE